jgi:ribosome-binding factor A
MASYKTSRTEEDIFRELTALLRELKDPRIDPLLTIVRVELSNDMSNCKIYVSSLQGMEVATQSCAGLVSATGFLRRELFHRLKLRKSPALHFIADDSIAHSAEINQKLYALHLGEDDEETTV